MNDKCLSKVCQVAALVNKIMEMKVFFKKEKKEKCIDEKPV
jgi:hypothetical protein